MDINHIIIYVIAAFVLLGAADRITGSRFTIGDKFEEGIMAMGTLTISTGGLLVLAPLIGEFVRPVAVPLFTKICADPAMLGGMVLGLDIGGAPLAQSLMKGNDGYVLALLTASMLGDTISFNIPVGMTITKKEHQKDVAKGMLIGIITIPIGIITGGNVAIMLAGAFVLVELVTRLLKSPLQRGGARIGINEDSVSGLLIILANPIPIFKMMERMDSRGKVMATAFCVSGAFTFGDHLGFIASYAPDMILTLIAAKLAGAISAAVLAYFMTGIK